jgi:uncharacterized protein
VPVAGPDRFLIAMYLLIGGWVAYTWGYRYRNAESLYKLGRKYDNGDGVERDSALAVQYYRKAARQGHIEAQNMTGVMYGVGDGVPQDLPVAASWYCKAAEQGSGIAKYNLGVMYCNASHPWFQDLVVGYMWLELAAMDDARWGTYRDSVSKLLTPAQIAEAQKLSREWKPKR